MISGANRLQMNSLKCGEIAHVYAIVVTPLLNMSPRSCPSLTFLSSSSPCSLAGWGPSHHLLPSMIFLTVCLHARTHVLPISFCFPHIMFLISILSLPTQNISNCLYTSSHDQRLVEVRRRTTRWRVRLDKNNTRFTQSYDLSRSNARRSVVDLSYGHQ